MDHEFRNPATGNATSSVVNPRLTLAVFSLLGMLLLAVSQTRALNPSPEARDRLEGYLLGRANAGFSGAVLVARGSEILIREGYGFADLELGARNTPETVFRIGSVTKPLVAAAALRLVASGRLRLDDSLARYLPESPDAWQQVTIEHLLSHTSGIPDLFGDVAAGPPAELRELVEATLSESDNSPLDSAPGDEYAYNNFGYLLLAYVIELSAGRPWIEVQGSRYRRLG